jgi:UPF0042 nucleotide-binding protein
MSAPGGAHEEPRSRAATDGDADAGRLGGNVVVVTGLSGAGKSTAMSALEDLGYYCIENLPPSVIAHAVEACESRGVRDVALALGVGIDGEVDEAAAAVGALSARVEPARQVRLIFLDASDEAVLRRFSETRRPHPLLMHRELHEVIDAIRLERERLAPLRALASFVIDTSGLRVHDLRRRINGMMRPELADHARMQTRVLSFGFKHGLPSDADLVFDVRFLDNPYFVPELRPLTGEDPSVRDFVLAAEGAEELLERLVSLLEFLLPKYEREGKSYLTVAVGCTGGQHRSVAIARALVERLGPATGRHERWRGALRVVHRDAHAAIAAPSSPGTPRPPPSRPAAPPDVKPLAPGGGR